MTEVTEDPEEVEAVGKAVAERLERISRLELSSRERNVAARAAIRALDEHRTRSTDEGGAS